MKKKSNVKEAAKWFNAVADAWNMGLAPWAYTDGRSEAVKVWCANYAGNEGAATAALASWAAERGIRLKRGKLDARGT